MQNDIIRPPKVPAYPPEPASSVPEVSVATVAPPPVSEQPAPTAARSMPTGQNPKSPPPQKTKKSKKPLAVIMLAIVVCLLLAGIAVYLKLQADKNNAAAPQPAAQTVTDENPAVTDEVDATLNETNDLPSSQEELGTDLTDDALGL